MARVWREGQRKPVWIYRFLGAGSIEEKIYQRQVAKEGLSRSVVDDAKGDRHFSSDELRQLFHCDPDVKCDTHVALRCTCGALGDGPVKARNKQAAGVEGGAEGEVGGEAGEPEGDGRGLLAWAHFVDAGNSPD